MRWFYAFSGFVLLVFVVYVAYAIPFLNEHKAHELWGDENKWAWYGAFCAYHFAYALIPILVAGTVTFLFKHFTK